MSNIPSGSMSQEVYGQNISIEADIKYGFITLNNEYYESSKPLNNKDIKVPTKSNLNDIWDREKSIWRHDRRLGERMEKSPSFGFPDRSKDKNLTPETNFQLTLYQLLLLIVGVFTVAGSIFVFQNHLSEHDTKFKDQEIRFQKLEDKIAKMDTIDNVNNAHIVELNDQIIRMASRSKQ
jgi:hypothetical protein